MTLLVDAMYERMERVAPVVPGRDWLDELSTMARPGESLLDAVRRLMIVQALRNAGGEQKAAAAELRVSTRQMNYWCRIYGLQLGQVAARVA